MKYSIKGVLLIAVIFFSLAVAQSVSAAETSTVEGIVDSVSFKPNMVVIDGLEIYGVSFNKLEAYNIPLSAGVYASIDVYEYTCSNGDTKLMAYSVTVGDVTVVLRAVPVL